MNQEDIICIAREAGLKVGTNISGVVLVGSPSEIGLAHLTIEEIERFAALIALRVAAAEREACAQVAEALWRQHQYTKDAHERLSPEPFMPGHFGFDQSTVQQSRRIAHAIRARGRA